MKKGTLTKEEQQQELCFLDSGKPWELGKPCISATMRTGDQLGPDIGTIVYSRDERFGAMYSGHNIQGKEIYVPTFQLYEIKEQFIEHQKELLAELQAIKEERAIDPIHARTKTPVESIPSPYDDRLAKESKRAKKLKGIRKDDSLSHSHSR